MLAAHASMRLHVCISPLEDATAIEMEWGPPGEGEWLGVR